MAPVTEGKRIAEFLLTEANGYRSREEVTVTVPANTTIPAGRIMAVVTATGVYVPHDADGTDNGTRAPRALLYDNLVNSTGAPVDTVATIIARDAEFRAASVTHDPAGNAAANASDLAALAAYGLIAR